MKCNSMMLKALHDSDWSDLVLPQELLSWVDKGFIALNGCVFLAALSTNSSNDKYFDDKTGVECFVNSFHMDDYVDSRYLDYSCLFCNAIFDKWIEEGRAEKINAIASMDEYGVVLKFHVIRHGEQWLNDDLEKYEESIFVTSETIKQMS